MYTERGCVTDYIRVSVQSKMLWRTVENNGVCPLDLYDIDEKEASRRDKEDIRCSLINVHNGHSRYFQEEEPHH